MNPLPYLFLACLFACPLFRQEIITVTATGLGQTVGAARKSAVQKAGRKALGEIMAGDTITNNAPESL